jgi:signal transduction histidine kinase
MKNETMNVNELPVSGFQMPESIIPANDVERLEALQRYQILDTPPERAFDRIASLTARVFKVPIALIALVDKDRVWFKSNVGMPGITEVDRGVSLCSLAILTDDVTAIENTLDEPCLLSNPLVAGKFGMRFYAGAPIKSKEGYNLGTVCIVDKQPREFTEADRAILQDMAAIVQDEIELRLAARSIVSVQADILGMAVHDLKNPLSGIAGLSKVLPSKLDDADFAKEIVSMIGESCDNMMMSLDAYLKAVRQANISISVHKESLNIHELLGSLVAVNSVLAQQKEQVLTYTCDYTAPFHTDKVKLVAVLDNLISNSIKYSYPKQRISIVVREQSGKVRFEVIDEGQGLSDKDKEKIFKSFARLSAKPTGGESSTRLGLGIAKINTELLGGKIWAESEGKNKGTTFIVELPLE